MRLKSGREREREREKEKDEKLAKLAKLDQLENKKESGRTAAALSVLLPYKLSKVPVPVLIVIYILGYLKVIRKPPIQKIAVAFCFCF